jgi:peroxiredoxin Q/BCP
MIKVGERIPNFTLASTVGSDMSIAELKGKKAIMYFYPKDNTPG